MSRVLMSINTAWNVVNFRANLVRALIADGHDVVVAVPDDGALHKIANLGARVVALPITSRSMSITDEAALLWRYLRVIHRERPDVYLGWTIKPNTYGSLAARLLGAPRINTITGLGTAFIHQAWLRRIACALYGLGLGGASTVFFQNADDRAQFRRLGLASDDQAETIPGSGVDLSHFDPALFPSGEGRTFRFLMVARLIRDKGVHEYVEAARMVRSVEPRARFQLLGALGVDNRTAIPRATVAAWVEEGLIDYLGEAEDVRSHLAAADCVVLPSYREGLSRTLIEAAAMAKPAIAADVPGCREVIEPGRTGLLCAARDAGSLAGQMRAMLALDAPARRAMGQRARERASASYAEAIVIAAYRAAIARALRPADISAARMRATVADFWGRRT